jgi:hypothetical protein
MNQQRWNRDQLVKVLSLYCQIPFGRMHNRNPAVSALAASIGRTPSAVALKLVNFASLDPELKARGVGGMGNTSTADRSIWDEFYGRWDVLANNSILDEATINDEVPLPTQSELLSTPSGATASLGEVWQRRGQSFFRASVIAAHDGKCCITGITSLPLLRASHIVPWSKNATLRLDPRNGLCLNALHDAAFDRGLITLSARFELQVSTHLKGELPDPIYDHMFGSRDGLSIAMPERFKPAAEMLDYHRSEIFRA